MQQAKKQCYGGRMAETLTCHHYRLTFGIRDAKASALHFGRPWMESLSRAKVPDATAAFWTVKILTTGLGETTSDFFIRQYDPVVVIPVAGAAFIAALAWQWLNPRFSKWRYWLAVALVAVFGTMVADAVHVVLGVPYGVSTAAFALLLTILFGSWSALHHTLSIHSIVTRRREAFYWAAVIVTFALGTATGDLTATGFGVGYLASGILFLALFALPLLARRFLRISETLAFWASYVLTRPLGASFADWFGVSPGRGGLNLGTGEVSVTLATIAIVAVATQRFNAARVAGAAE